MYRFKFEYMVSRPKSNFWEFAVNIVTSAANHGNATQNNIGSNTKVWKANQGRIKKKNIPTTVMKRARAGTDCMDKLWSTFLERNLIVRFLKKNRTTLTLVGQLQSRAAFAFMWKLYFSLRARARVCVYISALGKHPHFKFLFSSNIVSSSGDHIRHVDRS